MEATNPQTTVASADLGALKRPSYFRRLGWFDWLFAAMLAAGAGYAFSRYGAYMDGYERGILVAAVPAFCMAWLDLEAGARTDDRHRRVVAVRYLTVRRCQRPGSRPR